MFSSTEPSIIEIRSMNIGVYQFLSITGHRKIMVGNQEIEIRDVLVNVLDLHIRNLIKEDTEDHVLLLLRLQIETVIALDIDMLKRSIRGDVHDLPLLLHHQIGIMEDINVSANPVLFQGIGACHVQSHLFQLK